MSPTTNLDYLLNPISTELIERAYALQRPIESLLLIDFKPPVIAKNTVKALEFVSLFEHHNPHDYLKQVADKKFQCVIVNLQFDWLGFTAQAQEIYRILLPGGVFLFSSFGADTLSNMKRAWSRVDSFPHVHEFQDMHHHGDSLLNCRFEKPIVDTDWLRIAYPGARALMSDLRGAGLTNVNPKRRKSLSGKGGLKKFIAEFDALKVDGMVLETFEVIYGVGKKPTQEAQQAEVNKSGSRSIKVDLPAMPDD